MKKVVVVIVLVLALAFVGCSKDEESSTYEGSLSQDDQGITLEFTTFNQTITHDIEVTKDDWLDVAIVKTSGSLTISITDEKGNKLYSGNDPDDIAFSVGATMDGTVTIKVTGKNAVGSVNIRVKE